MNHPERPLIDLTDVRRVFGPVQNRTMSLDSVSLRIYHGEFVAVVGPSGAGKSTLLNILGLLDRPTSGRYEFDGVDVSTLSESQRNSFRNARLGFIFQASHMLLDDTAGGNATLPLKVRGTRISPRRSAAKETLEMVGLSHRIRERTINLSGGERQRVAAARAIVGRPDLILADEPTGALDRENSRALITHLRELNSLGVTIVIITHDPDIAALADRRVHLVDGRMDGSVVSAPPARVLVRLTDGGAHNVAKPLQGTPDLLRVRKGSFARRFADEIFDAVSSLSANAARTLLLLVAFAIAVGGLVSSIGIAQSAAAQVATRLTEASLDEVVVRSGDPAAFAKSFYASDGFAVSRISELDGVLEVGFLAPLSNAAAKLSLLPKVQDASRAQIDIMIVNEAYLSAMGAVSSPSASAALLDNSWGGAVAVLGHNAAASLGVSSTGPGNQVWINGESIDVVGILVETGRAPELTNAVMLSKAGAGGLVPEDPRLVLRTEKGMPAAIAAAVPIAISPSDPSLIRVETVADLRNLQLGVASDLGSLVAAVSVLLLLLAVITSAVAMYLSVHARKPEIALRRAVGASKAAIWRLFTVEGLVVGAAGGVAGAALGLCVVVGVCLVNQWSPITDPVTLAVGLGLGAASGVASAAYPAFVASRLDPALAIRG